MTSHNVTLLYMTSHNVTLLYMTSQNVNLLYMTSQNVTLLYMMSHDFNGEAFSQLFESLLQIPKCLSTILNVYSENKLKNKN